MAGVPYIFGNATTSIPLTNLDANFNTGLTIGNTTVGLGNTVTTLGNVTLNNANFGAVANAVIYTNSGGNVTSNATIFSVNSGNVGIGTSSPQTILQANTTVATTWNGNDSSGYSTSPYPNEIAIINNQNATTNSFSGLYFQGGQLSAATQIHSGRVGVLNDGTTYGGAMAFSTRNGSSGNMVEAMRIDSSGNVAIGASTAAQKLSVAGSSVYQMRIWDGSTSTSSYDIGRSNIDGYFRFYGNQSTVTGYIWGGVDGERMRIDTSGKLLVNTASSGPEIVQVNGGGATQLGLYCTPTTAYTQINFRNGNGVVGSVQTNGSSTSFNTSSDYRLKNTIAPMTGALSKVALLKPVTYKWNADGSDGEGFIAHELAEVVPDCVTGEKDEVDSEGKPVYQGIDTSFLVATLTAAIQELKAIVDIQAIQIAELQAKVGV
jgi:hypothetical protein